MWLTWGSFALVQIVTNRYMKGRFWGTTMWIHRFFGLACLSFTGVFATKAWYEAFGWGIGNPLAIMNNSHSYFVFPVLWFVLFVVSGGIFTRSVMRRSMWNTKRALRIKMIHRICAYFVLLCGLLGIATGIYHYRVNKKHYSDFPLEWVHSIIFVLILGTMEVVW